MSTTVTHNQVRNTAVGQITESGVAPAAVPITIGFKPRFVCVVNTSERITLESYENMTAAHALKTIANGTRSKLTSLGITLGDTGFIVGLDTGIFPTHSGNNVLEFLAVG